MQYMGGGLAGLQGIFYVGTNCIHRRKVIYGLSPDLDSENGEKDLGFINGTQYLLYSHDREHNCFVSNFFLYIYFF